MLERVELESELALIKGNHQKVVFYRWLVGKTRTDLLMSAKKTLLIKFSLLIFIHYNWSLR